MSVNTPENEPVVTEQVVTDTPPADGNPKWKPILDAIPDELHHLIKPQLAEWDKGINNKFQEIHGQYDPYKPFIENKVDPQTIQQSLYLLQELEKDPAAIVKQAIEAFGLDFVEKAAVQAQQATDPDPDEYWGGDNQDITKHPQFQALAKQVEQFSSKQQEFEQAQQSQTQAEQFEQYLEQLQKDHGEFDTLYVTALISNGVDGAQAVKQYHDTVNQAAAKLAGGQQTQQQATPPVVMGGDGTTGSGMPNQSVSFGQMKNNDLNDLVAQIIAKNNEA